MTKKMTGLLCVWIALILVVISLTACGSDGNKDATDAPAVQVTEAPTEAPTEAALSDKPTDEDMEYAVNNPFSEGFCEGINDTDLFSMDMTSEDNTVIWRITFKVDLTEDQIEQYKEKFLANDMSETLPELQNAVSYKIDNTNFNLTVRYYTKDGDLILEQTTRYDD